jgi:hypothetical protein
MTQSWLVKIKLELGLELELGFRIFQKVEIKLKLQFWFQKTKCRANFDILGGKNEKTKKIWGPIEE